MRTLLQICSWKSIYAGWMARWLAGCTSLWPAPPGQPALNPWPLPVPPLNPWPLPVPPLPLLACRAKAARVERAAGHDEKRRKMMADLERREQGWAAARTQASGSAELECLVACRSHSPHADRRSQQQRWWHSHPIT
jgi:hypothetical protein